jgi:hypothetical protein
MLRNENHKTALTSGRKPMTVAVEGSDDPA